MNFTNTDCVNIRHPLPVNKHVGWEVRQQVKRQICTILIPYKIEQEIRK